MPKALWLALVAVSLPGCTQVLQVQSGTGLAFACAALASPETLHVEPLTMAGGAPLVAAEALAPTLAEALGRGASSLRVQPLGELPSRVRDEATLADWAADEPFNAGLSVRLRVVWAPSLADANATGAVVAPGVVLLSTSAIASGAQRAGASQADVAWAVLLHHVGHALGMVNLGIPVQDADRSAREGPPHHDPDPASVMAAGWEDARTLPPPNGTLRYPDGVLADWAAARSPGGACR